MPSSTPPPSFLLPPERVSEPRTRMSCEPLSTSRGRSRAEDLVDVDALDVAVELEAVAGARAPSTGAPAAAETTTSAARLPPPRVAHGGAWSRDGAGRWVAGTARVAGAGVSRWRSLCLTFSSVRRPWPQAQACGRDVAIRVHGHSVQVRRHAKGMHDNRCPPRGTRWAPWAAGCAAEPGSPSCSAEQVVDGQLVRPAPCAEDLAGGLAGALVEVQRARPAYGPGGPPGRRR